MNGSNIKKNPLTYPIDQLVVWLVLVSWGVLYPRGAVHAQNNALVIRAGTTFNVRGNSLVLNNLDLYCDGSFNAPAASVWLTGNHNTSFYGSSTPLIGMLELNTSPANTLSLNSNLQVSGALVFRHGLLDLNGRQLQLTGPAVLQGERETSRLIGPNGGNVTASAVGVSHPDSLNIGQLGAVLTSPADLGNVNITRWQMPVTNLLSTSLHGVQRTFLIQPANDLDLDAVLRLYYFDAELNGDDASTLVLWKSADGVTWTQVGAETRDTAAGFVEKSGITDLSYWTLSDAADPLPLVLLSFTATCEGAEALIHWQTGAEGTLDHFLVQRSPDGTAAWTTLGQVSANHDPSGAAYSFSDPHPLSSALYRLQLVDRSGATGYSPVFNGGCSDLALPFMVYPNPAERQAVAQVSVRSAVTAAIQIVNMTGRTVYHEVWDLEPGIDRVVLPLTGLAAGSYLVRLSFPDATTQEVQLIKK
jgi:hypothetical protein